VIPRKIHYCWLSGEPLPDTLKRCLDSWGKVMPDYELVKWDTNRFDIESSVFALEAFRARKWAFAADYIRLHALNLEGGIYLDSDVLVTRRFDDFLTWDFFTSMEYHEEHVLRHGTLQQLHPDGTPRQSGAPQTGIGIEAAVLASVPGHPFIRDCLAYYRDRHFILEDGTHHDRIIAPDILAMIAVNYGLRYRNERQELRQNMLVLPTDVFASGIKQATSRSYAIHYGAGSWRNLPPPTFRTRVATALRELRFRAASLFGDR
jgi:hypothetical protein